MNNRSPLTPIRTAGLCLGLTLAATGCQSNEPVVDRSYQTNMISAVTATKAINFNDPDSIEQAKTLINAASSSAETPGQVQAVQSLRFVVAGAEAMGQGKGEDAVEYWKQIPNDDLRIDLMRKAQEAGLLTNR
ncbi:MAG: hypothetical protein AAGA57_05005 [Planctomycetota bacterium]